MNVNHAVALDHDLAFRTSYSAAWQITIDGAPLFAYARMRGIDVVERVTGVDLLDDLLHEPKALQGKLFFVVADDKLKQILSSRLSNLRYREDRICIRSAPCDFARDAAYQQALADEIKMFGPTLIIFGIGCPRSEMFLAKFAKDFGDCYGLCVGAGIEYFCGMKARAPRWLRRVGFEWVWRVVTEPRRLLWRYLRDAVLLGRVLIRDIARA